MINTEKFVPVKNIEWFEVWFDDGLMPPYILLLTKTKNIDEYIIYDLLKSPKADRIFNCYEDAFLFLTEDEYSCVKGRERII